MEDSISKEHEDFVINGKGNRTHDQAVFLIAFGDMISNMSFETCFIVVPKMWEIYKEINK